MHLRDASVDLDGNIVVAGQLQFPADDNGYFSAPSTSQMFLVRRDHVGLVPCEASRERSGFYSSKKVAGPSLSIPEALASVILKALRFGAEERLVVEIRHQDGALSSGRETGESQPLSNWRLEVQELDGTILVELSATLHTYREIPDWQKHARNYWSSHEGAAKVTTSFTVDPMTRTACFEAYVKSIPNDVDARHAAEPHPGSLATLNLERAPVGSMLTAAFGDKMKWVKLLLTRTPGYSSITIVSRKTNARTVSGLLHEDYRYPPDYPYLSLPGSAFDLFEASRENKLQILLTGGTYGHLNHDREYDGPYQMVTEAKLDFQLDANGLRFSYDCTISNLKRGWGGKYRPGTLGGHILLTWELLMLRFPKIAPLHVRFLPETFRGEGAQQS